MIIERKDVEAQLERILSNRMFKGSARSDEGKRFRARPVLSGLLKFMVMKTLDKLPLSDAIITREYFHKEPQTFIKGEAIARVQVGELRERLKEYYITAGIDDPIDIDIPIGNYNPVFKRRETSPTDKELQRGLYHINMEAPGNIVRALEHFEEALRLNPGNAEAHAGKAMALCTQTLHDLRASPAEFLPAAEAEAKRALELNPNSWRAHAALGGIHAFRHEWALADKEFRTALTIDSEGTRDHGAYGPYLLGHGDYEAGRKLAKRDEEEYPTDVTFLKRAALLRYGLREFDEAERILKELFMLDEGIWHAHTLAALVCLATDRFEQALSHMRTIADRKDPDLWPGLHVLCLSRNGLYDEARVRFSGLVKLSETGYIEPLQVALGYIAFDDPLLAIEWLAKGAGVGDAHMLWLHLWPFLDPLREYSEFQDLLKRLGLPDPPRA